LNKPSRLKFLAFIIAPFVLLSPVYLTGRALFWGTPLLQFIPWWDFAWRTLLSGHLPLWNPLVGMGAPLIANYQSALFYPPTWIYFILYLFGGVELMAWGQALLVALHLAWAGLGIALLVRRLGLGVLAQVVAGLTFGLSSYLVAHSLFLSINAAVAWFPWVLLLLTPIISRENDAFRLGIHKFLLLVIVLSMQFLAGHAQITFYSLLIAILWISFWAFHNSYQLNINIPLFKQQNSSKVVFRMSRIFFALVWFAGAVIFALGISSIQLLPTIEYLVQSQRFSAVEYELALTYSFWPWRLITLFAPSMFGNPVHGDYWGYGNFWEDSIYIGLLPILLALGTILRAIAYYKVGSKSFNQEVSTSIQQSDNRNPSLIDYRLRSLIWLCFGMISLSFLLALGSNTPLYPWLYLEVPTFDMFQAPTRWMLWSIFSLVLLSAIGVEYWRRPEKWGLYWTRLGTAGAFAISLGAGIAWILLGDISPSFIRATTLLGVFGFGAGILTLTAPLKERDLEKTFVEKTIEQELGEEKKPSSIKRWKFLWQFKPPPPRQLVLKKPYLLKTWQWAVILFIAVDLLVMNWGLLPAGDLSLFTSSPAIKHVKTMVDGGRLFIPADDEYQLRYQRFLRFDAFDPGEEWINLKVTLLPNSNMLDQVAVVNNYDPLIPARYAEWMDMLNRAKSIGYQEMLGIMNVRIVEKVDEVKSNGIKFEEVSSKGVRFVQFAQKEDNLAKVEKMIVDGEIKFNEEVLFEGNIESPAENSNNEEFSLGESSSNLIEEIDTENPNLREYRLATEFPGWLVFSDVWYPGWYAWLDNVPVPIHRANYLFRAVHITPGDHKIILSYRPNSFWLGFFLTIIFSLVVIIGLILYRIRASSMRRENE